MEGGRGGNGKLTHRTPHRHKSLNPPESRIPPYRQRRLILLRLGLLPTLIRDLFLLHLLIPQRRHRARHLLDLEGG